MYRPAAFREDRPEILHEIMRRYGFATLISHDTDNALIASHVPVLFDVQRNTLRTHLARPNPQWKGFAPDREALVIFSGPHGYVTPAWYETKLAVPTWNYVTVHAYGIPRLADIDTLRQIVTDIVHQYESPRANPWPMDLTEEYMTKMLGGIVGLEIPVTRIEGKLKLNQNRSKEDVGNVIAGFDATDDPMLASWRSGCAERISERPPQKRPRMVT